MKKIFMPLMVVSSFFSLSSLAQSVPPLLAKPNEKLEASNLQVNTKIDVKKNLLVKKFKTQLTVNGGADSGGGNTIHSLVIENYQQDTSDLEVISDVEVKLKLISQDIPRFGKALVDRAAETKWYILPVAIEDLPASITGIGIATEQSAVQINKEVYIDQSEWKRMGPLEKTSFILHELVLAQYLWLKNRKDSPFPAITKALSMSDMRRISKLVGNYVPADVATLGNELMVRNYGYYLTRPEKEEREKRAAGGIKSFLALCDTSETRLLSQLSIILDDLYTEYRGRHAYANYYADLPKSALSQQHFEKISKLQSSFVLAWNSLTDIFPQQLVNAQIVLKDSSLFEAVFPGQRQSAWDAKMGQVTCENLKAFDTRKIKMVF